jgi:secondary thiamine-phosphate synthase enzyme
MHTTIQPARARHTRVRLLSQAPAQFIDITDELRHAVSQLDVQTGILHLQTLHTTTALVVNEHEPMLLDDFTRLITRLVPEDGGYDHDDQNRRCVNLTPDERVNGHAHCRALLLSPSLSLNVADSDLVLGQWQRVFFVEFDGPRVRELSVVVLGQA